MEPKQKAKELVEKFLMIRYALKQDSLGEFWEMDKEVRKDLLKEPKQCALICVDEIIKTEHKDMYSVTQCRFHEYWQNVKTEINEL